MNPRITELEKEIKAIMTPKSGVTAKGKRRIEILEARWNELKRRDKEILDVLNRQRHKINMEMRNEESIAQCHTTINQIESELSLDGGDEIFGSKLI